MNLAAFRDPHTIYVCGKYTAPTDEEIDDNIDHARKAALWLMKKGYVPLTPHLNTYHMEREMPGSEGLKVFYTLDLLLLSLMGNIYMLDNWTRSTGAQEELRLAQSLGIPVWFENVVEPPSIEPLDFMTRGTPVLDFFDYLASRGFTAPITDYGRAITFYELQCRGAK